MILVWNFVDFAFRLYFITVPTCFREIHSLVELVGGYGIIQRQHCSLALKETLPSGAYVSSDQLEDLARLGQVTNTFLTSL